MHVFFSPDTVPAGPQRPWYTLGTQGADFLDGNWHLTQGTFDGSILRLFLDGKELAALAVPGPVDFNTRNQRHLGPAWQRPDRIRI